MSVLCLLSEVRCFCEATVTFTDVKSIMPRLKWLDILLIARLIGINIATLGTRLFENSATAIIAIVLGVGFTFLSLRAILRSTGERCKHLTHKL